MAPFVTSLPTEAENQRWSILAPENGFEGAVRELQVAQLESRPTFLLLNVFRDDLLAWVRVIPDLREFEVDPLRQGVYHIQRGTGVFIDEDGRETDHWIELNAFFTAEVTTEGIPAGSIIMWSLNSKSVSVSPDKNRRTA